LRVEEGEHWRLVVDPGRQPFPVLVGGPRWAAELTAAEALALQAGIRRLREQLRQLQGSLMAEEAICLELEVSLAAEPAPAALAGPEVADPPADAGCLWISLEGDRSRWEIRFILTPPDRARRALEGGWPVGASAALAEAFHQLGGAGLAAPVA
jgi:hypothetical protein